MVPARAAAGALPMVSGQPGTSENAAPNLALQNEELQAQNTGTNAVSQMATTARSESSPVLGPNGKPEMNPDGTPKMQQVFKGSFTTPDGQTMEYEIPQEMARVAGALPYFDKLQRGEAVPPPDEIAQQSSDQISKHPAAADMANSLNNTGKAPPGTNEQALNKMQQQGIPEQDANALSNWWGEPGNMATVLGIGATAIGLLMTFMGGQDGLMGWLMPALGIAGTVGGLGTLGYQGMFGEGVQNAIQGFANPLMQQFGNMGYDAGLINQDQYWQGARNALTPEEQGQMAQAFGTANEKTPWYLKAWNSVAPEAMSVDPIRAGMTTKQRAKFDALPEKAKADIRAHAYGTKALPGFKPFQQPAEGPQITTY